jgi:DNA-binding beta-propeller fold protein YncE
MTGKRAAYAGVAVLASLIAVGAWKPLGEANAREGRGTQVPRFVVDPYWPKPIAQRWVTGEVAGTCIDSRDHIFTVNRRNADALETSFGWPLAPPVVEYDGEGNVVNGWGDPAILPNGLHGCHVDYQDNVWVAGNGDGIVQKYSHDGSRLLLQIGIKGRCDSPTGACGVPDSNSSTTLLNQPADIVVDPANGDIYIADGYGNHRVVVFDKNGRYLRQWGSAGTAPGQFAPGGGGHPHCVVFDNRNLLYVCDRANDRIQVFDKFGNIKEVIPVKPGTGSVPGPYGNPDGSGRNAVGSANDLDFSVDRDQKYMFVDDVGNSALWIYDRLQGNRILGGFGRPGHQAGEFTLFHSVAVDSKGNLYTGETVGGRRSQKFVPRGFIATEHLGTWRGSPHYDPLPGKSSEHGDD